MSSKLNIKEVIKLALDERKGKTSRNRKKKKKKRDRCLRIADRKFDKPSAYKSGAVVRCRKGNIWKGVKEEQIQEAIQTIFEKKRKEKILTNGLLDQALKVNKEDGLIVMPLMVKVDIKPVVGKKMKNARNTQHVNQHHQNVKTLVKVKHGVRKLLNLNNITK